MPIIARELAAMSAGDRLCGSQRSKRFLHYLIGDEDYRLLHRFRQTLARSETGAIDA
jgi:hypothetical protein